ncbi:HU family DNA-binding protein [Gemmobacter serpentinus]|uniref:HU family DNA-binding protein n=1 Tax=Gemmobacter serpentinus TaxID=2652247 RepID=UPI001CF6D2C6|nr:HU family DNA-binding protein [Gemmobacter serpentinus]
MATKLSDAKPAAPKPARKAAAKPMAKAKPIKAASKPASEPAPPEAAAIAAPPSQGGPEIKVMSAANSLKLKALIDQVAEASGAKPKLVKPVVEATLAAMGRALSDGMELNLPPFGKARVSRQKEAGSGEMLIVKLKRGGGAKSDKKDVPEGVAEAED